MQAVQDAFRCQMHELARCILRFHCSLVEKNQSFLAIQACHFGRDFFKVDWGCGSDVTGSSDVYYGNNCLLLAASVGEADRISIGMSMVL